MAVTANELKKDRRMPSNCTGNEGRTRGRDKLLKYKLKKASMMMRSQSVHLHAQLKWATALLTAYRHRTDDLLTFYWSISDSTSRGGKMPLSTLSFHLSGFFWLTYSSQTRKTRVGFSFCLLLCKSARPLVSLQPGAGTVERAQRASDSLNPIEHITVSGCFTPTLKNSLQCTSSQAKMCACNLKF